MVLCIHRQRHVRRLLNHQRIGCSQEEYPVTLSGLFIEKSKNMVSAVVKAISPCDEKYISCFRPSYYISQCAWR